jgi:hypothetical protein
LQRQHAGGILLVIPVLFKPLLIYSLIYLLFTPCSSSGIREASYGSMMPAIIIYYLFIYLLFSVCSSSMREASCWACHYCLLYCIIYLYFSACRSSMRETSCDSMTPAIVIYLFIIYLSINLSFVVYSMR